MRIVIETTQRPVEEIAAEPATLARLQLLLARARAAPHHPGRILPGGLLTLPLVVDSGIEPLTVHLRPSTIGSAP